MYVVVVITFCIKRGSVVECNRESRVLLLICKFKLSSTVWSLRFLYLPMSEGDPFDGRGSKGPC